MRTIRCRSSPKPKSTHRSQAGFENSTRALKQLGNALSSSNVLARPVVAIPLSVVCLAVCWVVLSLMAPAGLAVTAYQWGLASYREKSAHIVSTKIYPHAKSVDAWEVVVGVEGVEGTQTIDVNHQELFSELIPNEAVVARLVSAHVVAIRVSGRLLTADDNLPWLIGLPGGILGSLLFLMLNVRAARAGGLMNPEALLSAPASGAGLRTLYRIAGIVAGILFFSGFTIGAFELWAGPTPPWPLVAGVLAGYTVGGWLLSARMSRLEAVEAGLGPRRVTGALITALITPAKGGRWDVECVGDGRMPADLTVDALDGPALTRIDTAIAASRKSRPIEVSYAWYPWGAKPGNRTHHDSMIFNVKHDHGRFVATLDERPEVTASSETFDGLADAIAKATAPEPLTDKDVVTWDRTLTQTGFVEAGADETTP